jgi:hypothetical protein
MALTLNVETQLTRIRASKIAIRPTDGQKVSFDLHADIRETSRSGTYAKLRYLLAVETFPLVMRAEMEGVAHMDVSFLATDETLESLGRGIVGDLALKIFRDNYESLYLLLDSLGIQGPSPWLVRDVHLAG